LNLPLSLAESADLLGRYRYVELALFHALGARATSAAEPAVVLYLAGAARAHAWRARIIEERLPVSLGLPGTEASTRSPGASLDAAVALLVAPAPDGELVHALVDVLYPAMTASYTAHLGLARPVSDAPVVRALGRVLVDLDVIRREGLPLVPGAPDGALAAEVRSRIEVLGGPFGPPGI